MSIDIDDGRRNDTVTLPCFSFACTVVQINNSTNKLSPTILEYIPYEKSVSELYIYLNETPCGTTVLKLLYRSTVEDLILVAQRMLAGKSEKIKDRLPFGSFVESGD
jgi:hypothetical protein